MKKLFIFAALAAPLFFSCAKEMEQALEQEPEKTPVANVAFKASIESLDSPTKADINASNQLVWAAGDQIGVYIPDWVDKNKSGAVDTQNVAVVSMLNITFILLPAVFLILGTLVLKIFPINKKTFGSIRSALDKRAQGEDYSEYMDDINKIVGKK